MKVIGTIGLNGSGKDTVVSYISKKFGIPMITISDIVRKIASTRNIEPTRENLTRISLEHIEKYGSDYFPKEAIRIIDQNKWDVVGVAGIRSLVDVETFRKKFRRGFILIFVQVSDPAIRFERIRKRGEPRDPKTFEQFMKQDAEEEKNFKLSTAIREANYVISNDGDIDSLINEIENLVPEIIGLSPRGGKTVRNPTKSEKASPSKTMRAAEKLLSKGETNMAATYFWNAAKRFEQSRKFSLSASAYEKAAYCYELDGYRNKAAEEYLTASKMYALAGLNNEAKTAKELADENLKQRE